MSLLQEVKFYNITLKFMQNPNEKDVKSFKALNLVLSNAVYRVYGQAWDSTDTVNVTVWVESKYKQRNTQDLSDI